MTLVGLFDPTQPIQDLKRATKNERKKPFLMLKTDFLLVLA